MSSAARCGALESEVVRLQNRLKAAEDVNIHLLEQIAEVNLKLVYMMRHFKYQRVVKSGLVDASGKPQGQAQVMNLEQIFAADRDKFIDHLLKEADDAAKAESAATPPSDEGAEASAANAGARPGSPVLAFGGVAASATGRTRH